MRSWAASFSRAARISSMPSMRSSCASSIQTTLAVLWRKTDSALFNAVYVGTGGTMVVTTDDGKRRRVTGDGIRDLSDRLLALCYSRKEPTSLLRDMLFDLAREGSFAAMRELLARYELDAFDRGWLTQVLEENSQLS